MAKKDSWLDEVEFVSLSTIKELQTPTSPTKFRYPTEESAWCGWYDWREKGRYIYATCTAPQARCEPGECGKVFSGVSEKKVRHAIELHIIRGCDSAPLSRLRYITPKECPF